VFLQTEGTKLPKKPENINLFTEKCQKATFMFSTEESKKKQKSDDGDDDDATLSIAEEYFSGRCGRTEVLFKEVIGKYTIVVLLASARYVSKKQLVDAKRVAANYRKEIEKYVKNSSVSDSDEEEEEDRAPQN
jgi:hypothetical protein